MGTRLREHTEYIPKPLVTIGSRPILWHIMKIFAHYGYQKFICALGYKGEMIKRYFLNYEYMNNDFTITLGRKNQKVILDQEDVNWSVTLADTGLETGTGGRIKRVERYVEGEEFLVTYGDGVADIDMDRLIRFHREKGRIGTVTGIHPSSRFGIIESGDNGLIRRFREKPRTDEMINGGFFVFNPGVFDYLDPNCIFEKEPMERLVRDGELAVYEHKGVWFCMDTYRDYLELNRMWDEGRAAWKVWGAGKASELK
ncbi:MAG: glucose-1-phosphate cytidylyltransferase [Desulfobacterales bacterium]|nr:glucose-1-phosphate cytidylyltransferase [Desulfobacterales bacterium]